MPAISLMALRSSQLDNKLCTTTSTGIKTLAVGHDGWSGDPGKFARGQNNCRSLLLKLFSRSQSPPRRTGLARGRKGYSTKSQHTSLANCLSLGVLVISVEIAMNSHQFSESESERQNRYTSTHWLGWMGRLEAALLKGKS